MLQISDKFKSAGRFLAKEIPYPYTWVNVLAISALLGGVQVFITIFLEPHGTGDYDAPYRNLRLAGFALCFVFPFLLFYPIERLIYKWQNKRWFVYDEVLSKSLLVMAIATASFFYNITVINTISPTFERWMDHMLLFSWPYIPIFIPIIIIFYVHFYKSARHEPKLIKITGENRNDILEVAEQNFVYAESDQNYVTLFYLRGEQLEKKIIRSSLQAVNDQIDSSIRIHRSYLINPEHLEKIKGNKRQRFAILHQVDESLPVSTELDCKKLLEVSRSSQFLQNRPS